MEVRNFFVFFTEFAFGVDGETVILVRHPQGQVVRVCKSLEELSDFYQEVKSRSDNQTDGKTSA